MLRPTYISELRREESELKEEVSKLKKAVERTDEGVSKNQQFSTSAALEIMQLKQEVAKLQTLAVQKGSPWAA